MADVDSVRLAEGKARRTPDTRLSNAEARHKTFREGFSVRRVSASSHAVFPRRNCRNSFDLQINKAAPPAGVCPLEQSPTSHCEDRALPGLSPVQVACVGMAAADDPRGLVPGPGRPTVARSLARCRICAGARSCFLCPQQPRHSRTKITAPRATERPPAARPATRRPSGRRAAGQGSWPAAATRASGRSRSPRRSEIESCCRRSGEAGSSSPWAAAWRAAA